MSRKYSEHKCSRDVYRRRRRKKAGKKVAGAIAVILLSFIIIFRTSSQDTQSGFSQDPGTESGDPHTLDTGAPWYLTLVNRQNPVPEGYRPNLAKVQGGEQVDERIYDPLMKMLEAAKEANGNQLPHVVSGYRTESEQQRLYDDKISQYEKERCSETEAKELAEQWVAAPGYSEHQLGVAVDINGAVYDVYLWLQENSYKYGFIFRYPGDKTQITNIAEEVWHYRYVGVEAATEIYEQGLCLEEYMEDMENVLD